MTFIRQSSQSSTRNVASISPELTRTASGHAALSLARMASHETAQCVDSDSDEDVAQGARAGLSSQGQDFQMDKINTLRGHSTRTSDDTICDSRDTRSRPTSTDEAKSARQKLHDGIIQPIEDSAAEIAQVNTGVGEGPEDGVMNSVRPSEACACNTGNDNEASQRLSDSTLRSDPQQLPLHVDLEAKEHEATSDKNSLTLDQKKSRNDAHDAPDAPDSTIPSTVMDDTLDEEQGGAGPNNDGQKGPQLQDQTNLLPFKQIIIVFAGISCALFVGLLDQTIVSTALPTLGRDFGRADIVSWVGTSYLLTSTAFQPIYSRLSDIFGRKIMLVISLAIFFFGSLACALAQSMIQLIIFRALAGIGGGGILTLSMIVISDVVSLKERGKYQGILGGVVALANSVGPILGGTFTETIGWRWCFWINLPMTAVAIVVVIVALPLKSVKGDIWTKLRQVDYYGSILTLAFSVLILMALSWGGTQYAWDSAGVLAPLLIGIALLGVFIFVEWKLVALPLIPMSIFRTQTVAGGMIATFLAGIVFYGQLFYLPQYFQVVREASAIRSGVLLLPLVLVQTTASFVSGWIVSKTGDYRINLYLGYAIWTIAVGLLSTIGPKTSIAKLCGYQILAGIGGGQTFQTMLVAIQAAVTRQEMAVATGARNFLRSLGGSVSLAACAALLNNAVKNNLERNGFSSDEVTQIVSDPTQINTLDLNLTEREEALSGYTKGIQNVFYFMIPCSGISFFLVVFFVKHHSLKRGDEKELKEKSKSWTEKRKQKKRDKKTKHNGSSA